MDNSRKSMGAIYAVVALVLGGVGGYVIGNSMKDDDNNMSSSMQATTDTKAADLRVLLNNLNGQHADVASEVLRAGYDETDHFAPSAKALDVNSVALSKSVGAVYGPEAEAKFLEIWRSHITFFANYAAASKAGDEAEMAKQEENLAGYVAAISNLLSGATGLPEDAVSALITEHVALLKSTVDRHADGDHEGSYSQQQLTRDQITTKVADTLSGAIVKQNPDKFTGSATN